MPSQLRPVQSLPAGIGHAGSHLTELYYSMLPEQYAQGVLEKNVNAWLRTSKRIKTRDTAVHCCP